MILLHGRGSNAERFAYDQSISCKPGILQCQNSSAHTLPQVFPGMKFVFPTALRRRSTARKRKATNIWFNNSSFEDPFEREGLQIDGLSDNFRILNEIVQNEARQLSLKHVFLGGISQGCAMALHVLLGLDGNMLDSDAGLGGFIGMSGWLPFQSAVNSLLLPAIIGDCMEHDDDEENPFATEIGDMVEEEEDLGSKVSRFIREDLMNLPCCKPDHQVFRKTPIFMGHGDQDDIVELAHGKDAVSALNCLDLDVFWKVYEQQGHWFGVPTTIDDMIAFLKKNMNP